MTGALDQIWMTPLLRRNAAVLRVGLGSLGLLYYLSHYFQRHELFGPQAFWSHESFIASISEIRTFSVYVAATDALSFDLIYHIGILAALSCALGLGGRISIALHYVMIWSLYQRNPALLDGGDNLTYLLLPALLLTKSTDYFAVLTRKSRGGTAGVIIHNLGTFLIIVQVLSVYFLSGIFKAHGDLWLNGTALYYILRTPEFFASPLSPYLFTNVFVVTVGTYAAMLLLIFITPLVSMKRTREHVIILALLFHLSIAILMGLWGFAFTMMLCDVMLLPESRIATISDAIRARVNRGLTVGRPADGRKVLSDEPV